MEKLRCNNGELSAFWMSSLEMVESVVLGLLRASREGNCDLHLHAIRMMIARYVAYGKVNYARYLTPYYAQMPTLSETNPDVREAFRRSTVEERHIWTDTRRTDYRSHSQYGYPNWGNHPM